MTKKAFMIVAAMPILIFIWPIVFIFWAFRDEDTYLVPLAAIGLEVVWIAVVMQISISTLINR